jgi:microcompartment protein CcmL/EutN
VEPKDEPEPVAEVPAEEADVSVLKGKVADVKAAVDTGTHDGHLEALLAAEEGGKARKGVLKVLQDRIART